MLPWTAEPYHALALLAAFAAASSARAASAARASRLRRVRDDDRSSVEVEQTYELFTGILEEAASIGGLEPSESYFCKSGQEPDPRDPDPHYTLRAWRAVVTYLLRQPEFLYE